MKIRIDKEKLLEFKLDVSGVLEKDIKAYLRFTVEGIEYGFPATVKKGKISVKIPAFNTVISENVNKCLSESEEVLVTGRLDVVANENSYVRAWQGEVNIEVPVSINVSDSKERKVVKEKKKQKIKVTDPELSEFLNLDKEEDPTPEIKEEKNAKSKFSRFIE